MSTFKVGQKVVCVDDFGVYGVRKGQMYVIAGIGRSCGCFPDQLNLQGLVSPEPLPCAKCEALTEPTFRSGRFRPLIEDLTASLARTESERWVEEKQEHVNEPQHA